MAFPIFVGVAASIYPILLALAAIEVHRWARAPIPPGAAPLPRAVIRTKPR